MPQAIPNNSIPVASVHWPAFCILFFSFLLPLSAFSADDPSVKVAIDNGQVTVDVELTLPVKPQTAWEVWTDYENMPQFIPSLSESRVIAQQGNLYQLQQKGYSQYGPISLAFDSICEHELIMPYREIKSRQLRGTLKSLTATTTFIPENGGTRVAYHADSVPGIWMPPVLTETFIEHGTRAHYILMREEVLRRAKRSPMVAGLKQYP
jgi:ribosome-associated toxin RatA of RatAB toxin-antitoxin module